MDDKKKKQVKQSQCCASRCQMSPPVDLYPTAYMRFHRVDTYAFGFTFSDVYVHVLICAIVDVGKIGNQLSKYSAKLADVRKLRCAVSVLPLMNLSNPINPASVLYTCIRVYTCIYVLVYDTVCLCIYVYEPVKRDKHRVRLVVRSISGDIMTSSLKSSLKMLWTLGSLISQMSNKVPD